MPDEYLNAVKLWWSKRHNFQINKDWILYSTNVIPAILSIIHTVTSPGEHVLIKPTVYNIFYNSILNNGRRLLESNLVYKQGRYN